jgi:hypothetical protein
MTDGSAIGAIGAFDRRALLGAAGALGTFLLDAGAARAEDEPTAVSDTYPSQDPAVVREVVTVAHGRIERLRELVTARPELANAAWDWGFGDWESALGAASHMGRRDIAGLLLAHGARPDVFTAAMLGDLPAVRSAIEAFPGLQRTRGPHGITLLAHARAGGEGSRSVLRYLESLGDADPVYRTVELGAEDLRRVQGVFVFGAQPNDRFVIESADRGGLMLRRGDGVPRPLFHLGGLEFHPSGAPSARIRVVDAAASLARLEIRNPDLVLAATRPASP